jgi:hypothetical protein
MPTPAHTLSRLSRNTVHVFLEPWTASELNNLAHSGEEWEIKEIRQGRVMRSSRCRITSTGIGVIMTNHDVGGDRPVAAPLRAVKRSLGCRFVGGFKIGCDHAAINRLRGTPGLPIWQRNYYEHVIRDEESLNRIRQYIADNPIRWNLIQRILTPKHLIRECLTEKRATSRSPLR